MNKFWLSFLVLFSTLPAAAQEAVKPVSTEPPKAAQPVTTEPATNQQEESTPLTPADSHIGITAGTGWVTDYPGAAQGRMRYLIMPAYKGRFLTIDRQEGAKGEVASSQRIKFSVSFSFLFPTDSDKIPIRQGMPDLDWTFQLGPEIQLYLIKSFYHTMYLLLPLRFVATTDFRHRFESQDWNLAPSLRNVFYLGKGLGEITTRLEVDYTSERYNDFFYEVEPKYATPNRPAFDAKRGLLEYIVGANYSYYDKIPWVYFIGTNVYLTGDSVNRGSPLMQRTVNYAVFGGMTYYF